MLLNEILLLSVQLTYSNSFYYPGAWKDYVNEPIEAVYPMRMLKDENRRNTMVFLAKFPKEENRKDSLIRTVRLDPETSRAVRKGKVLSTLNRLVKAPKFSAETKKQLLEDILETILNIASKKKEPSDGGRPHDYTIFDDDDDENDQEDDSKNEDDYDEGEESDENEDDDDSEDYSEETSDYDSDDSYESSDQYTYESGDYTGDDEDISISYFLNGLNDTQKKHLERYYNATFRPFEFNYIYTFKVQNDAEQFVSLENRRLKRDLRLQMNPTGHLITKIKQERPRRRLRRRKKHRHRHRRGPFAKFYKPKKHRIGKAGHPKLNSLRKKKKIPRGAHGKITREKEAKFKKRRIGKNKEAKVKKEKNKSRIDKPKVADWVAFMEEEKIVQFIKTRECGIFQEDKSACKKHKDS